MNTVNDCLTIVRNRLIMTRRIYQTISTERFESIFNALDSSSRAEIVLAINANDPVLLRSLLKKFSRVEVELMSIRELRLLGQKYGVPCYNNISKAALLTAIKGRINEKSETIRDARKHEAASPTSENKVQTIP